MSELLPAPPHDAPTRRLIDWTPASMREWPGRVSAVIRLGGCSFACPYCLETRERDATVGSPRWEHVRDEIASHPWLDGVVVTGGEPTEDPDLPSLLAALAELDLPVRLETNGARPDVLRHLIGEQLVDCVAIDIKTTPGRYSRVSSSPGSASLVAQSVEMVIRSGIDHEFSTTVHPDCVSLDELPRIARSLRGGRLYALRSSAARDGRSEVPGSRRSLQAAAQACSAFLPTIVREPLRAGARSR